MQDAFEILRAQLAGDDESLALLESIAKHVRKTEFRLERTLKDKEIASHVLTRTIETLRHQTAELKHQQQLVEEKSRAAEAANRAKSTFLANMSHELRTPLNAILGYAQLLQRDDMIGQRHRQTLGVIRDSGDHLLTLINDVLEMSKIEAGRAELRPESTSIRRLVAEVVTMLEQLAREKQLELRVEIDPSIPEAAVLDRGKLRQILLNLVGNALKFTHHGWVSLRLRASKGQIEIVVQDTGPGIGAEEKTHLFDAFVQTDAGRAAKKGTGLGLALSRSFARLMRGDISFQSTEGEGATFRVHVAYEESTGIEPQELPDAQHVVGIRHEGGVPRILVVEDHDATADLMSNFLGMIGFKVEIAGNGREAVAQVRSRRPDLVLMDIHMPVMDGFEATRRIKGAGNAPPIIALSASVFETDQSMVVEAGCDAFLSKPVVQDELLDLIRSQLDLEYRYDDAQVEEEAAPVTVDALAGLRELPDALRDRIRHAARRADPGGLEEIADALQTEHPGLADGLRAAVNGYNFSPVLAALNGDG